MSCVDDDNDCNLKKRRRVKHLLRGKNTVHVNLWHSWMNVNKSEYNNGNGITGLKLEPKT